jgi:hypothetical protein
VANGAKQTQARKGAGWSATGGTGVIGRELMLLLCTRLRPGKSMLGHGGVLPSSGCARYPPPQVTGVNGWRMRCTRCATEEVAPSCCMFVGDRLRASRPCTRGSRADQGRIWHRPTGGSWEDLAPSLIPLSCGRCTQVRRKESKFGPRVRCPGACADPGETFRKPGATRKVVGDPDKPCPCYAERCPGPATDWLPRGDLMRERRQLPGNAPAVCPTTVALCTVEPLEVLTLSR